MPTLQEVQSEANSTKSAAQLSPEALHYRAYGTLPTATQNTQQKALSKKAPGYVVDTADYGAGSTAQLVGGEAIKTPNYKPLAEGQPTMQQELDAGTLAKPATSSPIPPPVNTKQPNPATVQAQPYTSPNGTVITPGQDQGTTSAPSSKFQQGFEQATAAGTPTPTTNTGGAAVVQQYSPNTPNDPGSMFVQADPYIESLVTAWQQYISPENQRASLTETYNKMLKDSGIQAIDTQLINMKNVIDGSEQDIRTEITKAGGFATDSQVLALTDARNKQLIKNYNTLLETKDAKEKYLQTAIQLEQQDRQAADQRFEASFNMGLQIADYHQKMQTNAVEKMKWLAQTVGLDGLYDSTGGDPYSVGLVEQTLGLPSGGLITAANQARTARAQAAQEQQLGLQLKGEQIKTEQAQRAKIYTEIAKIQADMGTKNGFANPNTPQGQQQLAQSQSQIQQISGLINNGYLSGSVGPNYLSRLSPLSMFTGGKSNFIAGVEQLRSQLNLQSLIEAKSKGATFGALSDQEGQMLANAATKIGTWAIKDKNGQVVGYNASEGDFKQELDKINNFAKLDYALRGGNPADVGIVTMPDGTSWVQNSDGTMTKLR